MTEPEVGAVAPATAGRGGRRLDRLITAGLVDSFGLSLGWTVFVLHAVATQGLATAAAYSSAMLVGIGLSAPVAGLLATRLDGRHLLQSTAVVEGGLRAGTFALLVLDYPVAVIALLVVLSNVVAWTGYAGMRAEIAGEAVGRRRTRALTWYAGGIAAIEAAGAALAAVLPLGPDGTVTGPLLLAVVTVHVLVLVPTFVVARGSRIARAARSKGHFPLFRCAPMFAGGFAVMLLASGPAFLAVALTAALHGRMWVAPAALAFTAGALVAPLVVAGLERRRLPATVLWPLLGVGMIAGWALAPLHPAGILLAQVLSGIFMTSLEGTMDARVADVVPERVTAGMGWAGAVRALGSAAAVGAAPTMIAAGGLGASSALAGTALACVALFGLLRIGFARTVRGLEPLPVNERPTSRPRPMLHHLVEGPVSPALVLVDPELAARLRPFTVATPAPLVGVQAAEPDGNGSGSPTTRTRRDESPTIAPALRPAAVSPD